MYSMNPVLNLPEWYRLERETEKTIGKLVNLKELDYYLRNSDEYLRRLALLRLSVLKPRDCENILIEILEDHYESNENKELAALVLKAVALKWRFDIFINSRYLTKYTGAEELSDLYRITCEESLPSIRFNFSKSLVSSLLPANEDTQNYEENTFLSSAFDLKQWLVVYSSEKMIRMKSMFSNILSYIKSNAKTALIGIFFKLPVTIAHNIKNFRPNRTKPKPEKSSRYVSGNNYYKRLNSVTYCNPDMMPLVSKFREPYTYNRPSVFSDITSSIKKVVFNMLYVFFYPARVFLKHKLALVFFLLAVYIFLNFTYQGGILFRKYTGEDFIQFQTKTISDVKNFSISIWKDFSKFTGLNDILAGKNAKPTEKNALKTPESELYSVTAQKGLNIRKAPDPSSEKVTGGPLPFGSTVTFLNNIKSDPFNKLWYYIKAEDGRSGWVSSKYIKKREG